MLTFCVPTHEREGDASGGEVRFSVPELSVLFAGSRFSEISQSTCGALVERFARHGFSFLVGCADGVDCSFRRALAHSPYRKRCFVACAFSGRRKRARSHGLFASVVVPEGLPPKAALHRRTLWMVKRCSLAVPFPENPRDKSWGKGSRLVFRACLYHLKPLFMASSAPPPSSIHYHVLPSSLFGAIEGFWVVPHPISDGGTCDEEF